MNRSRSTTLLLIIALALAILLYSQRNIPIAGTGWVAKRMCSAVFVGGRDQATVIDASLPLPIPIPIPAVVDRAAGTVTAFFGGHFAPSTARYRPTLGCTLEGPEVPPSEHSPLDLALEAASTTPLHSSDSPAPLRFTEPARDPALEEAIGAAFSEDLNGGGTRAVVVLEGGVLKGERYAEGFSADTPLPGWSMAKSVTSAMVGILARDGRLELGEAVGLPEWPKGDPRAAITWDELLRMSSGLAFEEDYEWPNSDAIQMLFGRHRFSKGRYAAALPLAHVPDSYWSYSSGTSNILQYAMLDRVFQGDTRAYLRFPREALFEPLGMTSAVIEADESGVFVGSSHVQATARDWARFGLLYLDRGMTNGRRILDETFIDYTATPTPTEPGGTYGAHWWLNANPADGSSRRWPSLDPNLMIASGFEGQYVIVVPDHDLVVVRLGFDRNGRVDIEAVVAGIVDVLSKDAPNAGA